MNVVHIDTGAGWRGGQQQVLWLLEGLRERGANQLLLAPSGSPLARKARDQRLEVAELASPAVSLRNRSLLRSKAAGFDLIHAHDARSHTLVWIAGPAVRKPPWTRLVVSRRVAFPIGRFSRLKYWLPSIYLAVSEHVRQRLLGAGIPPRKIRVVRDGVQRPCQTISPAQRAAFRRAHGAQDSTLLVGTLTSLAPEKLVASHLDSLAGLPPNISLWVGRAADDSSRPEAEAALLDQARRSGVERRFRIFSLGDELELFLASLDLFLYLSESEGLGSAILLAMAHGLPVVASNVGGIPEIVRHGETGLLVGGDLKQEVPAAIQALFQSSELRQRLAAAGREFVSATATSDRMVAQTAAVYEELLRGSDQTSA